MSASELERASGLATFAGTCSIVLAGGYSWSDSPFDRLVPRPLLPVADSPLSSDALGWLHANGILNAVVCINRPTRDLPARLARHVPADLMGLTYHEDVTQRGPAGCVRDAASESAADTFIVADATVIPNVDLAGVLLHHRVSGAALTIVAHHEHPPGRHTGHQVPCGIYIIDRRALDHVKDVGYVDIKENLIPTLHESGERVV